MSSKSLTIANDVAAKLNSHVFTPSFTAQLSLTLNLSLYDLNNLTVLVSPLEVETVRATRSSRFKTYTVGISVIKHVENITTDFPPLIELVENIDEFLADPVNRSLSTSQYVEGSQTVFDYPDAEEESNFIGLISAKYRIQTP